MADVKKIATRVSYGEALVELANEHDDFVVLDADLAAATKTGMNDKPKADQRMKKVTVETFGVDYPEPEKL